MPAPHPERKLAGRATGTWLGHDLISQADERVSCHRGTSWVAIVIGVIFFFASLVKFVFHHWELRAFRSFGLPSAVRA